MIEDRIPCEFTDIRFRRALMALMIQVSVGAATVDEVLATAGRVRDGDAESWVLEWVWAAGQAWAAANQAMSFGASRQAGSRYLHAASYYAAALSQIARSGERQRAIAVWRRQRWCWEKAIELAEIGAEAVEIPYADTSFHGHFFSASGAVGKRRPLVIMHNGAYGPASAMLGLGGATAAARGYHWMTFDGPGQQSALHRQGLFFRPDWEAVLTAVLDAMTARSDVDVGRIAAVGVGHAGYFLSRALAHEHRLVAVAVQSGIVDVAAAWRSALPASIRALLQDGDTAAFDRALHAALLIDPQAEWSLRARAFPFGVGDAAPSLMFATIARYRLDEELASVRTPLLIIDTDTPAPWPGQSRLLHEGIGGSELGSFQADPYQRENDLFGWLEPYLR
jgi:dienelactone hydrolase